MGLIVKHIGRTKTEHVITNYVWNGATSSFVAKDSVEHLAYLAKIEAYINATT